jgi:hypothetical protein
MFSKIGAEIFAASTEQERGQTLVDAFLTQMDAYYASPSSSFYDDALSRRFYEQKLRHLGYTPYPNDGLITFGASGTAMCDRQLVFKNARGIKAEKSDDIPFRGRQRRQGTAIVDFVQLDIVHMRKRLGSTAKLTMAERFEGGISEWDFEDAAQERRIFEWPNPETGELVKFAITAKPDGKFVYEPDGSRIIFEYKTKASGLRAMNGKLDFKGAQDEHKRQVTAEALVFGIDETLIVYESTQKPAWFDDAQSTSVTKGQKTWDDGQPRSDLRAFYVKITEEMKNALLSDLARQAALVYEQRSDGAVPDVTTESVGHCGFCQFSEHCRKTITPDNLERLRRVETAMESSQMAGKAEHRNVKAYLAEAVTCAK